MMLLVIKCTPNSVFGLHLPLCRPLNDSLHPPLSLSIYLSLCLSIYLSLSLYLTPSIYLSIHPSIYLLICISHFSFLALCLPRSLFLSLPVFRLLLSLLGFSDVVPTNFAPLLLDFESSLHIFQCKTSLNRPETAVVSLFNHIMYLPGTSLVFL